MPYISNITKNIILSSVRIPQNFVTALPTHFYEKIIAPFNPRLNIVSRRPLAESIARLDPMIKTDLLPLLMGHRIVRYRLLPKIRDTQNIPFHFFSKQIRPSWLRAVVDEFNAAPTTLLLLDFKEGRLCQVEHPAQGPIESELNFDSSFQSAASAMIRQLMTETNKPLSYFEISNNTKIKRSGILEEVLSDIINTLIKQRELIEVYSWESGKRLALTTSVRQWEAEDRVAALDAPDGKEIILILEKPGHFSSFPFITTVIGIDMKELPILKQQLKELRQKEQAAGIPDKTFTPVCNAQGKVQYVYTDALPTLLANGKILQGRKGNDNFYLLANAAERYQVEIDNFSEYAFAIEEFEDLLIQQTIHNYPEREKESRELLKKALRLAQKFKQPIEGMPLTFYEHLKGVALLMANQGHGSEVVAAALTHTEENPDKIERILGPRVAALVRGKRYLEVFPLPQRMDKKRMRDYVHMLLSLTAFRDEHGQELVLNREDIFHIALLWAADMEQTLKIDALPKEVKGYPLIALAISSLFRDIGLEDTAGDLADLAFLHLSPEEYRAVIKDMGLEEREPWLKFHKCVVNMLTDRLSRLISEESELAVQEMVEEKLKMILELKLLQQSNLLPPKLSGEEKTAKLELPLNTFIAQLLATKDPFGEIEKLYQQLSKEISLTQGEEINALAKKLLTSKEAKSLIERTTKELLQEMNISVRVENRIKRPYSRQIKGKTRQRIDDHGFRVIIDNAIEDHAFILQQKGFKNAPKLPENVWQRKNILNSILRNVLYTAWFHSRLILERLEDEILGYPLTMKNGTYDDYVIAPKPNGYQSLQVSFTGITRDHKEFTLELQMRTSGMHLWAEVGGAAHFRYKGGSNAEAGFDYRSAQERFSDLRYGIQADRVFFYLGEKLISLPTAKGKPPTLLDLLYSHGRGPYLREAQVNGKTTSTLDRPIQSGDRIDFTAGKPVKFNPAWVNKATYSWVRAELAVLFKVSAKKHYTEGDINKEREESIEKGEKILEAERISVEALRQNKKFTDKIKGKFPTINAFFLAVGEGKLAEEEIKKLLSESGVKVNGAK